MTPRCPAHRTQRQKDFSQVLAAHILQWTYCRRTYSLLGMRWTYIIQTVTWWIFPQLYFADFLIKNLRIFGSTELCVVVMHHGRSVLTYCLRGATSVFEVLGLTPLLTPRGIVTLSTPLAVVVVVYHVSIVVIGVFLTQLCSYFGEILTQLWGYFGEFPY